MILMHRSLTLFSIIFPLLLHAEPQWLHWHQIEQIDQQSIHKTQQCWKDMCHLHDQWVFMRGFYHRGYLCPTNQFEQHLAIPIDWKKMPNIEEGDVIQIHGRAIILEKPPYLALKSAQLMTPKNIGWVRSLTLAAFITIFGSMFYLGWKRFTRLQ